MTTSSYNPLSQAQIAEFYREGFVIVPHLISSSEIDAVLEEALKTPVVEGGNWTPRIFDHAAPLQEPKLHRLLVEPQLTAAVEQILEAPARVYYGMLAIVPARSGKGLEWHQDNQYDHILGRALNCFVALSEITPDSAILWVAPRTHLLGVQPSETVVGHRKAAEPANGHPLPTLHKGDVCIFDRSLLHHSKTNETQNHRYAYAAQYQELNARRAETGEKDPAKMLVTELRDLWA